MKSSKKVTRRISSFNLTTFPLERELLSKLGSHVARGKMNDLSGEFGDCFLQPNDAQEFENLCKRISEHIAIFEKAMKERLDEEADDNMQQQNDEDPLFQEIRGMNILNLNELFEKLKIQTADMGIYNHLWVLLRLLLTFPYHEEGVIMWKQLIESLGKLLDGGAEGKLLDFAAFHAKRKEVEDLKALAAKCSKVEQQLHKKNTEVQDLKQEAQIFSVLIKDLEHELEEGKKMLKRCQGNLISCRFL